VTRIPVEAGGRLPGESEQGDDAEKRNSEPATGWATETQDSLTIGFDRR
jgi:hypothetical protein